jgi:predicted transcriptional regulator
MSHTTTVRLTKELADWLDEVSARTGLSRSRIIREQLERARAGSGSRRFMALAGTVRGAKDLSSRKGFSRP